jgi:hypothetical protein
MGIIEQLKALRTGLQRADKEIREASPKCLYCGRPTGGIVQAGETLETAGLCDGKSCAQAQRPRPYLAKE